jgi:S-(hydroxymethyl)glutathione dehydrogenase/alcohol dehydrogenase
MKGSGIDAAPASFRWKEAALNAGQVTTFSEETIVAENRVTPIPSDFPLDVASLLGCAATTGLGVVCNDAGLRPGQSLVVFGAGGLGLSVLQAATLVSATPIVAVDLIESKLERAKKLGATHGVNGAVEDAAKAVRAIVGAAGADVAVDTTGNASVRRTAYDVTSNTGTTVLAGVPHHADQLTMDSFPLHFGRRIVGSHGGSTRPDVDIPRCVKLYKAGAFRLDELITHRFPLSEVNDAIDLVRKGEAGRCLLIMDSTLKGRGEGRSPRKSGVMP